ncbi:hypothetical protein LJC07_06025 [Christensenellaceae bacterium OttesenSCG-928-L17]|nr:hypothetical protein [Christensenellaceae bacterium OttesenSCG-928-L17]
MTKVFIEKELGAIPSATEMEVVDILVLNKIPKKSVKFLKPNRTKGAKTPDLQMDGAFWEIKSIEKLGKYTLDHAERAGLKQADNLIFDLRKLSIVLEKKALAHIEKNFYMTRVWRGLIVVVRPDGKCLTFKK